MPLPADQGTGLGKPLKLINTPVREGIPVMLAAIGPKNVELAAEIAEIWEPIFFQPERAADVWGEALAAGRAKRDAALGDLQIEISAAVALGDDVEGLHDLVRPALALYIGGMGARGRNFYNDLAVRYGYADAAKEIQDLYLDGKKDRRQRPARARRPRAGGLADRPGVLRRRAAGRLRRGRGHHGEPAAAGRGAPRAGGAPWRRCGAWPADPGGADTRQGPAGVACGALSSVTVHDRQRCVVAELVQRDRRAERPLPNP